MAEFGAVNRTRFGAQIKDKKVLPMLVALSRSLHRGEQIDLLVIVHSMKPMLDYFAVTNGRLLGLMSVEVTKQSKPAAVVVNARDLVGFRADKARRSTRLIASTRDGEDISFGVLTHKEDLETVLASVARLREVGPAPEVDQALADATAQAHGVAQHAATFLSDAQVVGTSPSDKAYDLLLSHALGLEKPWLIIGAGTGGVLAAFEDRLMIVKVGPMTALMAGTLGGSRSTTIMFSQITGIEYNAGMMTGVLEILTASYQGSANKDFWKGTHRSRNADSNDPFTLSNTLPLIKHSHSEALPLLNELRARVAKAKQNRVTISAPARSLADELAKLDDLRTVGVLSDEEFAKAKMALLK